MGEGKVPVHRAVVFGGRREGVEDSVSEFKGKDPS